MADNFWGYNKVQVDDYLSILSDTHRQQLEELQTRLCSLLEENNLLAEELNRLNNEKLQYEKNEYFLKYMESGTPRTVAILQQSAEKELSILKTSLEDKLSSYNERISQLRQEIGKSKKRYQTLHQSISGLLEIELPAPSLKLEEERFPLFSEAEKSLPASQPCKVISYSEKHLSQKSSGFWELEEDQATTAGQKKAKIFHYPVKEAAEPKEKPVTLPLSGFKNSVSEFWDEVFTVSETAIPGYLPLEPAVTLQETATIHGEDTASAHASSAILEEIAAAAEADVNAVPEATERVAPVPSEPPTSAVPAASKEIQDLRTRYIVGKLAGETLFGANGSVIITKHSVITKEVVAQAETESKLSELILNMILPGMES